MIRILHSVSNMDRAGIETMLMNYYRKVDRSKVQFDFLCNKQKEGAYDEEIIKLGGKIYHTPGLNPIKYLKYLRYMKKEVFDNTNYEIIEAHNGALGVYSLFAAKIYNIPIRIFHAHGASITKDWKYPLKLICKIILPHTINQRFSCGIAAAKCYFGKKCVEENKYNIIPNAIEIEKFAFNQKIRQRIREEYNLTTKHVIGHVGRFANQKNQMFLIDILAEIVKEDENVKLILIGDGKQQKKVKEKVDKMKLSQYVVFLGNIENVNEWYQAFDVFVLPSIWEGLPVVGVEAQAADLPCVFSDSITEEIKLLEKTCFISLDEKIECWSKAILEGLNNRERRNDTSIIAQKGYDITVEAKKLQDRYLNLTDKNL